MRCHICDTPLKQVRIDGRDNTVRPCGTCEEVIFDAVGKMADNDDFDALIPFLDEESALGE